MAISGLSLYLHIPSVSEDIQVLSSVTLYNAVYFIIYIISICIYQAGEL